jgi:hypothetical protein
MAYRQRWHGIECEEIDSKNRMKNNNFKIINLYEYILIIYNRNKL